jgi:ferrous iron transport protein B
LEKENQHQLKTIALVGNPNAGKSTLFNALTGLNQKTGNFPGVTVDKKSGFFRVTENSNTTSYRLIDLPGTYSLFPKSPDEKVTCDVLLNENDIDFPDIVISVADATNLKRSLLLTSQIIDLEIPVVLALNMSDEADKKGIEIDVEKIQQELKIPVALLNSRKEIGLSELKNKLLEVKSSKSFFFKKETYPDLEKQSFHEILKLYSTNSSQNNILKKIEEKETLQRFKEIGKIIESSVKYKNSNSIYRLTEKIDETLTHPVLGFIVFLSVLFLVFQSIFFIAEFPMSWIENFFAWTGNRVSDLLPNGFLNDLLVNGILAGLSGVVVFVPQIALLFGFISLLEDSGYMARVSFMMDKLMRQVGLNGRSVIPLISGVACAVPAIMGTRTISNFKERIITILVTPLMSCSARLPVYTLLISLMVNDNDNIIFFNTKGVYLFIMYIVGFAMAMLVAFVLSKLMKTTQRSYFIMEMPIYRVPQFKTVVLTIYQKVKVFLIDAGKIIIAVSILLWWLSSNGPKNEFEQIEKKYEQLSKSDNKSYNLISLKESEKLEHSYVGKVGKFIEPAISPLGFDWKIGISLITSFAAREVFVGTMATIYSAGDAEDAIKIRDKMSNEINPSTQLKKYNEAVCWSLLVFYAFAMQCISTLAVVFKETKEMKWVVIQFLYMGILAYVSSWIIYQWLS